MQFMSDAGKYCADCRFPPRAGVGYHVGGECGTPNPPWGTIGVGGGAYHGGAGRGAPGAESTKSMYLSYIYIYICIHIYIYTHIYIYAYYRIIFILICMYAYIHTHELNKQQAQSLCQRFQALPHMPEILKTSGPTAFALWGPKEGGFRGLGFRV